MNERVKVKLWSMNETRRFAAWARRLKHERLHIREVRMNQNDRTVELEYERIEVADLE